MTRLDLSEELREIYDKAIKLARDDNEHEHYYDFVNGKFVSLLRGEIEEYLEHVGEGEEDEYLDDIINSGDYIRIPDYYDEERFIKEFAFTMDYNHAFYVEADSTLMTDLYNFIYEMHKTSPYEHFGNSDYIKNSVKKIHNELDDCYCLVLGHDQRVFGFSFYLGEEGRSSMRAMLNADLSDRSNTTLLAFTQKCLTFYIEKPEKADKESKELTRKYLGDKADEVVISILRFDGRSSQQNGISFSNAFLYMPYIEAFMNFFKKYQSDGYKYKRFKQGQHVSFTFDDENDKVSYKKEIMYDPFFDLSDCFLDSVPSIYENNRKTSKIYEFKVLTADDVFNIDNGFTYFAPIVAILNHKTGKIVALNVVLSSEKYYVEELFQPIADAIFKEGLPKEVIIDTFIDAMIADRFFDGRIKISFGELTQIDMIKKDLVEVPRDEEYDA